MSINRAQEFYDNECPYDKECPHCEDLQSKIDDLESDLVNEIKRGDEQFDRAEQIQSILDLKEEAIEELADKLRDRDEEIVKLRGLLNINGVKWEIEE